MLAPSRSEEVAVQRMGQPPFRHRARRGAERLGRHLARRTGQATPRRTSRCSPGRGWRRSPRCRAVRACRGRSALTVPSVGSTMRQVAKDISRSTDGSFGRPRTRSPRMLRITSLVPPAIPDAGAVRTSWLGHPGSSVPGLPGRPGHRRRAGVPASDVGGATHEHGSAQLGDRTFGPGNPPAATVARIRRPTMSSTQYPMRSPSAPAGRPGPREGRGGGPPPDGWRSASAVRPSRCCGRRRWRPVRSSRS